MFSCLVSVTATCDDDIQMGLIIIIIIDWLMTDWKANAIMQTESF